MAGRIQRRRYTLLRNAAELFQGMRPIRSAAAKARSAIRNQSAANNTFHKMPDHNITDILNRMAMSDITKMEHHPQFRSVRRDIVANIRARSDGLEFDDFYELYIHASPGELKDLAFLKLVRLCENVRIRCFNDDYDYHQYLGGVLVINGFGQFILRFFNGWKMRQPIFD